MIRVTDARTIIPIHTTRKRDFADLHTGSAKVCVLDDGQVYTVE